MKLERKLYLTLEMYFKKYMTSCGKFVRMTAHYNLWGQTLIFEKWDFNDKNSCFYKVTNIFNEVVSP